MAIKTGDHIYNVFADVARIVVPQHCLGDNTGSIGVRVQDYSEGSHGDPPNYDQAPDALDFVGPIACA